MTLSSEVCAKMKVTRKIKATKEKQVRSREVLNAFDIICTFLGARNDEAMQS